MLTILTFKQIKNGDIFKTEYSNLLTTGNASIEFKMQPQAKGGIAIIYAPNGTGKTSLCEVLDNKNDSTDKMFVANYNGQEITGKDKKFHVIKDQMNRHVIPGDTSDYLIGANIHREYELKKKIADGFLEAFNKIPKIFKSEYKVTKKGDYLISRVVNNDAARYIREIIPNAKRGKSIDHREFIQFVSNTAKITLPDAVDADKRNFIIGDVAGAKLIEKILGISLEQIVANAEVSVIEQNDDAIGVLKKYKQLQTCIVCDNEDFNANFLLKRKIESRKRIYESLDPKTKELLDKVINDNSLKSADPFDIKNIVSEFISHGDIDTLKKLQGELNLNISYVTDCMLNNLLNCFDGTTMFNDFSEYLTLLETQPEIDSEELLFIQEVISENIGPEIAIVRDEANDKNFKLMLAGQEFLGVEREQLHLSNGEQNFISLAFELLLARKSEKEFIIMDDPISSFDSVYKNKIAFCIVKFLEDKKQVILTHNTDLIRLLEVQQSGCFNLYLFNNVDSGNNGFIRVNNAEKEILINLYKLIKLFQNKDDGILIRNIKDKRQFLMAMIPFMRGYAHISKDGDAIYTRLSGLMHGYETTSINISCIYEKLFGYSFPECVISVNDILSLDCNNIDILDSTEYPLLAETLRQTLIYYYLRMKVEKELIDIFDIKISSNHLLMLNQIIRRSFAFNPTDADADKKKKYKVFFTSRKTLLNEFNHFEGNMNIFQPAIDIESSALQREIESIEKKLVELRADFLSE